VTEMLKLRLKISSDVFFDVLLSQIEEFPRYKVGFLAYVEDEAVKFLSDKDRRVPIVDSDYHLFDPDF
jgi:hypothetical protein